MRVALASLLAAALATLLLATPASADTEGASELKAPHKLRRSIVMGFSVGAALAGASGYPNDVSKENDPAYFSDGGTLLGGGGEVFVMGAFADYLNFGFWGGSTSVSNGNYRSHGSGGGFRVEAFPLYELVPSLSGLGFFAKFGLGDAKLTSKDGSTPEAGGTQSYVGTGVFLEWKLWSMLGGHVSAGPSVEIDYVYAPSIDWHGGFVGGRLAFYGRP
jgi:hypothetical protein